MNAIRSIPLGIIALALSAAASAQSSNVTLYGRLYVSAEVVKASGASGTQNAASFMRVSNNSSLFGLRGEEPLGDGWAAWFQIESSVTADAGTGTLAGRNTAVGVKSNNGGTFLLGFWDTPYKSVSARFDPFGDLTIASQENIVGQMSGVLTASGVPFKFRAPNIVQYWSPDSWGPLSVRVGATANEAKSATRNPWLASALVTYSQGPWFVEAAYEIHRDSGALVANSGGNDTGVQAGLQYKYANGRVGGIWERLTFATDSNDTSYHRDGIFIGANYEIGRWDLRASYGHAWDLKGTYAAAKPDSSANMISLGVGYIFSKRSEICIAYTLVSNEPNAQYQFGINPIFAGQRMTLGADSSGFLVGIRHLF